MTLVIRAVNRQFELVAVTSPKGKRVCIGVHGDRDVLEAQRLELLGKPDLVDELVAFFSDVS